MALACTRRGGTEIVRKLNPEIFLGSESVSSSGSWQVTEFWDC